MNNYRVELENDEFDIIHAETDAEAIAEALEENEIVFNVIRIDDDYNEIEWFVKTQPQFMRLSATHFSHSANFFSIRRLFSTVTALRSFIYFSYFPKSIISTSIVPGQQYRNPG